MVIENESNFPFMIGDKPALLQLSDENKHQKKELGLFPNGHAIEVAVYPVQCSFLKPQIDPSISEFTKEPSYTFGLTIEIALMIRSTDPNKYIPENAEYTMYLALSEGEETNQRFNENPSINALWPKIDSLPVTITRKKEGISGLSITASKFGITGNKKGTLEESFSLSVPRIIPFVSAYSPVRRVSWQYRATRVEDSIEGYHYCGVWVTFNRPCFLHFWQTSRVTTKKRFGVFSENLENRFPDTYYFVKLGPVV